MAHYLPADIAPDERLVYAQPDAAAFVSRMLAAAPEPSSPTPLGSRALRRAAGGRGWRRRQQITT